MRTDRMLSRRSWLFTATAAAVALLPRSLRGQSRLISQTHPTPRAGITAGKVATAEMLEGDAMLVELFDGVRAIPGVVDGIRCHCGCADMDGHYSLLSCYEGAQAMARICPICQGEGRVAIRMAKAGRSLAQIRVAIDAQYG